jgi:hypothetical protein
LHLAVKQGVGTYLIKSLLQGMGKSYSIGKNGRLRESYVKKQRGMWFLRIAGSLQVGTARKIIAAVFLFSTTLFYLWGLFLGSFLSRGTKKA